MDPVHPIVYTGIIRWVQAVAHKADECLGYCQLHMRAIPPAGCIGNDKAYLQLLQGMQQFQPYRFITEPFRVSYFQEELQVLGQGSQVLKKGLLALGREAVAYLQEDR